jgi:hypothetical protein
MVGAGAVFVLLIGASSPGLAAPKKGEPGWDPDRQICKSKPVVGSRLKKIRECATAQQWEDMRQQERNGLLRRQFNGSPGCRGCDGSQDSPI